MQSTVAALLSALARPGALVAQMCAARRDAERNHAQAAKSGARWPLGLLDDARLRLQQGKEARARVARNEADAAARELRYTQQTVAAELAGWQEVHEDMGRTAVREFARAMLVQERIRLDGLRRALRWARRGAADAVS
ncbi:hypothetical protein CDD81_8093 [Ophiocordyceps australis]|uniref:Sorting nexin/Vps5-like C-terminal domain-containing protein n=1 Tax=Ophiocordyceps australis TaxID=1399860 RepID=A0A2C5Y367_9HYPO|nr:hypothetical protein CDD81_8093 [Ophiocordyceps australis]